MGRSRKAIGVEESVDLPESIDVKLSLVDDADDLDQDRARLHAALDLAQAEVDRGEGVPASHLIAELRQLGR